MSAAAVRPALLLTRPAAASRRFAADFRARFGARWPVEISPLMETEPLSPTAPGPGDVIFTSQQAVALFAAIDPLEGRRAWCVGPRTSAAAQDAGYLLRAAAPDGRSLAARILAARPRGRLIHARGQEVSVDLGALLAPEGIAIASCVLYRQKPLALSAPALARLQRPDPVLVPAFSVRSAARLAEALGDLRAPLLLAPISPAVAQALGSLPVQALEIAPSPDAEGVMMALTRLLCASDPG